MNRFQVSRICHAMRLFRLLRQRLVATDAIEFVCVKKNTATLNFNWGD